MNKNNYLKLINITRKKYFYLVISFLSLLVNYYENISRLKILLKSEFESRLLGANSLTLSFIYLLLSFFGTYQPILRELISSLKLNLKIREK